MQAVGLVRADFNSMPKTFLLKWLVALDARTQTGGCVDEGVEEKSTYELSRSLQPIPTTFRTGSSNLIISVVIIIIVIVINVIQSSYSHENRGSFYIRTMHKIYLYIFYISNDVKEGSGIVL